MPFSGQKAVRNAFWKSLEMRTRGETTKFWQAPEVLSYTDLNISFEGLGGTNQVLFELMYKSKR